jgi:hypothetical protein
MKIFPMLLLLVVSMPISHAETTPALEDSAVTVSTADQKKLGIVAYTLRTQTISKTIPAFVSAVDIGPLLLLEADLHSTQVAAAVSQSEYKRRFDLAKQDQSASAQSVEAARMLAAADQSKLKLLQWRLKLEWSPALAAKLDSTPALLEALAAGEATLVRADAPASPNGMVGEVTIDSGDGSKTIHAEPVGLSGAVDPRMQTVGLFALVIGEDTVVIKPGRLFSGGISAGESAAGVVIPRSAIIRVDDSSWVYVQNAEEVFSRRELTGATMLPEGWFISQGFSAGEKIAVGGAVSLLAIERADESAEID